MAKKAAFAPKKVCTPGSYRLPPKQATPGKKGSSKGKETPAVATPGTTTPTTTKTTPTKRIGRPVLKKNLRKPRKNILHRKNYTEEDLMEAVRLVKEEEMSIKAAADYLNDVKLNPVPRHDVHENMVS
jgi:hypothetical protein